MHLVFVDWELNYSNLKLWKSSVCSAWSNQNVELIFLFNSGTKYPFKKISELNEDNPETCIIIGTFFKDQVLKPSILKEISEDNQLVPLPPRSNYNDENDVLILEDELQRIRLEGKINVPEMITGVVAAVLGELNHF